MEKQDFKNIKKVKIYLIACLVIVLTLFLTALTVSTIVGIQNKVKEGKYIGTRNTITVSDTGKIYAKPDLAIVNLSVKNEEKTVDKAIKENTEQMNLVIDAVKEQGIEDKDLKTTSFNIYPRYEYYERKEIPPYYPQGERVLVGYEINQSLQVKIRDMGKIGKVIEEATAAGANQVGNLQLTIDKQDEFKKQAREQAIQKTKAKAEELALQLGVNLVRITNFIESSVYPRFYSLEESGLGGGETPQIEIGENKIEVTVSITYEIN